MRLDLEVRFGDPTHRWEIFEKTVKLVSPQEAGNAESDVRRVWFTWTSSEEVSVTVDGREIDRSWVKILALSTKINRPKTHTALLGRYFISTLQRSNPVSPLSTMDSFAKYKVSADLYPIAWAAVEVYSGKPYDELGRLYERWRSASRIAGERIDAALTWSRWQLSHKKAHEAAKIVDTVRREDPSVVEQRWKVLCDEAEGRPAEEEGDEVERLEERLGMVGWAGLGTSDGILRQVVEEEQEDGEDGQDVTMSEASEQASELDEDEEEDDEADEDEDDAMEINF